MSLLDDTQDSSSSVLAGSDGAQRGDLSLIAELVRAGGEAIREISAKLRKQGALPLRDILVLDTLSQHLTEGVRTSRLASQTGMTTSRLAYKLKSLEKAGLARRDPHALDRRGVVVSITEAGRTELAKGLSVLAQVSGGESLFGPTESSAANVAHAVLTGTPVDASIAGKFALECLTILGAEREIETVFSQLMAALNDHISVDAAILWIEQDSQLVATCTVNADFWPTPFRGVGIPLAAASVPCNVFRKQKLVALGSKSAIEAELPRLRSFYEGLGISIETRFDIPFSGHRAALGVITGVGLKQSQLNQPELECLRIVGQIVGLRIEGEDPQIMFGNVFDTDVEPELSETERALLNGLAVGIDVKTAAKMLALDDAAERAMTRLTSLFGVAGPDELVAALKARPSQ